MINNDFNIYEKDDLTEDTAFMEIGLGKFKNNFWDKNSLYVYEDSFSILENLIKKYLPTYDHYGISNIPKDIGLKIANDLKLAVKYLNYDLIEGQFALNLHIHSKQYWYNVLKNNTKKIIEFIQHMAVYLEVMYESNEWIFIIGM